MPISVNTSLNSDSYKKYIGLVKTFLDKGIMLRHVKDLSTTYFAFRDKEFLFTIEKLGGKNVTNMIRSTDDLHVYHFNTVFKNLWKKKYRYQRYDR